MIDDSDEPVSLQHAIANIIASNERIQKFWMTHSSGWSPKETTDLLERSRMDRLVSLSHTLRIWSEPCTADDLEGRLILAWANLGILIEGTMTWFLCVWERDYSNKPLSKRSGDPLPPNELRFVDLCQFFDQHVWADAAQKASWTPWLNLVRERRNAVHAFNHRDIGDLSDWEQAVVQYEGLIAELDGRVPYPDARDY